MSSAHEIELFISQDGQLKVNVKGMKGPGCLKVTDAIAKACGEKQGEVLKPEYYIKEDTQSINNNLKR